MTNIGRVLGLFRTAGSERLGGGPQQGRLLGLVVTGHGGTGPGGELGAAGR